MQVLAPRLQQNFSRAANDYDARAHFQHTETKRVVDAAVMLLPTQARIADIGCGTGYFAALANRPRWHILGIDIAAGMCQVAATRCTAIQADATQLPLASESADAVVSSLCLQWVEDKCRSFGEIARVLRPGAKAILTSLGESTLQELHAAAAKAELRLGLLPMVAEATYKAAIKASGLEITMFERKSTPEYYATVEALLASMRAIGAGNNFAGMRGMTGAKRWNAMLSHYEKRRTPHGIPATWDRLFMILRKPA